MNFYILVVLKALDIAENDGEVTFFKKKLFIA